MSENTLPENTLPENTLPENTFSDSESDFSDSESDPDSDPNPDYYIEYLKGEQKNYEKKQKKATDGIKERIQTLQADPDIVRELVKRFLVCWVSTGSPDQRLMDWEDTHEMCVFDPEVMELMDWTRINQKETNHLNTSDVSKVDHEPDELDLGVISVDSLPKTRTVEALIAAVEKD